MPTTHATETSYADFSWKDFVAAIFERDPEPKHTFTLQFLDQIPKNSLQQYLGHFLMHGAKRLYEKELAALTPEEIDTLRKYLQSLGWDASYEIKTRMQKLTDGSNKETQVNYFLIDFFPVKRDELNDANRPERLA